MSPELKKLSKYLLDCLERQNEWCRQGDWIYYKPNEEVRIELRSSSPFDGRIHGLPLGISKLDAGWWLSRKIQNRVYRVVRHINTAENAVEQKRYEETLNRLLAARIVNSGKKK